MQTRTLNGQHSRFACWLAVAAALLSGVVAHVDAQDWPTYRGDLQRSNIVDEPLAAPLHLAWQYRLPQPPAAAWPERVKVINRKDYDYAPHPIVAGGRVFLTSNADDALRCLDLETGQVQWRFVTGGPIRVAPQVLDGKVYFGTDDGVAYCLDAATGNLVWRFDAAPEPGQFIGNHRMISRWPIRSGVLVADGIAYFTAGLWPTEGVYLFALDAQTGEEQWVNGTLGFTSKFFQDSPTGNHQGEFSMSGLTPESGMALWQDQLFIMQGDDKPIRFNRHTGEMIGGPRRGRPGKGGKWLAVDNDQFFIFAFHRNRMQYVSRYQLPDGDIVDATRDHLTPQRAIRGTRSSLRLLEDGQISAIIDDGQVHVKMAYNLLGAGNQYVMGQKGRVEIVSRGEEEITIWSHATDGTVYELAVTDGKLLAATDAGMVYCFAPGGAADPAGPPAAAHRAEEQRAPAASHPQAASIVEALKTHTMHRGYALVLGDDDASLSRTLVEQTDLHVVCATTASAAQVDKLRGRLIDTTPYYGTRLAVQSIDPQKPLPHAHLLFNAVIVAGDQSPVSGDELYRVLRPCGGVLMLPGLTPDNARQTLAAAPLLDGEAATILGKPAAVRGALPGALDYDNAIYEHDQRVRWPMRPIWFGGPDPKALADFRTGEEFISRVTAAWGRYFTLGEKTLTCVDAYNGTVLWTRQLPKFWLTLKEVDGEPYFTEGNIKRTQEAHWRQSFTRFVGADRETVYLTLGDAYFHGLGRGRIKLDVQTGEQLGVYAPWSKPEPALVAELTGFLAEQARPEAPGPLMEPTGLAISEPQHTAVEDESEGPWVSQIIPLEDQKTWPITHEEQAVGELTMTADDTGLTLTAKTTDSAVTPLDGWDLYFDFRPWDQRYGLYDNKTFHLALWPTSKHRGPAHAQVRSLTAAPPVTVEGSANAKGTTTTLKLTWRDLRQTFGIERPRNFGFGATLNAHKPQTDAPIILKHLFCDGMAGGLNNGWGTIVLADRVDPDAWKKPGIIGDYANPGGWRNIGAPEPKQIAEDIRTSKRLHPLTGEIGPKLYRSGTWNCGGPAHSATAIFRRASKPGVGIYDFADDSGLRFFSGVSAACGTNGLAALGVYICSEARFRCDCNPPIRTSVVLAPAEQRLEEDWALFYETDVRTLVRQASLNIGAFGDRRDDAGHLWLGYPREADAGMGYPLVPGTQQAILQPGVWMRHEPASIRIPAKLESFPGADVQRINADRAQLKNSDRPWVHASAYEGIRKLTMRMNMLRPLTSVATKEPIDIDGQITEATYAGSPTATLHNTETKVWVRHDAEQVYVAAQRPPVINRMGEIAPWHARAERRDSDVHQDDSFEVFLSDAAGQEVIRLGVSASGAVLDALASSGMAEDDVDWNPAWRHAVSASKDGLTFELAIPQKLLREAGLDVDQLAFNAQINQRDVTGEENKYVGGEGRRFNIPRTTGEAIVPLGQHGRTRCSGFTALGLDHEPSIPTRSFRVRLHFAELADVKPGERVFDVKLQDKVVLTDFDPIKEAGGRHTPVIRELTGIEADRTLTIEFVLTGDTSHMPILNGLELVEESWQRPTLEP